MPAVTFWMATLLAAGCGAPDYGLNTQPDEAALYPEIIETLDFTSVDISFDVALQRVSFSQEVGRCQVQLAFLVEFESDGLGQTAEDRGSRPEGPANGDETVTVAHHGEPLTMPTEPGECVLSVFDYDVQPGDSGEQSEGGDPEGGEAGQGPWQGNWSIRGSFDFGQQVLLAGAERDIWLDRTEDEEERVYYELRDCEAETFPFGEVFDLVVDSNPDLEFDAFTIEEAFLVGPELTLRRPTVEHSEEGVLVHPASRSLSVAWEVHDEAPVLESAPVHEEVLIWLQTMRTEDGRFEEALICRPEVDRDHFHLSRDWLRLMTANETVGIFRPPYETSFQVDIRHTAQPWVSQWGKLARVSSTVSDGGMIWLEEDPP